MFVSNLFLLVLLGPSVGSGSTHSKHLLSLWSAEEKRGSCCADGQEVQIENLLSQEWQTRPMSCNKCAFISRQRKDLDCVCLCLGRVEVLARCEMSVKQNHFERSALASHQTSLSSDSKTED